MSEETKKKASGEQCQFETNGKYRFYQDPPRSLALVWWRLVAVTLTLALGMSMVRAHYREGELEKMRWKARDLERCAINAAQKCGIGCRVTYMPAAFTKGKDE